MSEGDDPEVTCLVDEVYRRTGYDFRSYARASLRRRVRARVEAEGLEGVPALRARVVEDPGAMERFVLSLTVHVTAMFRDPGLYVTLREQVVPLLRTYPSCRIWHAGCSTGEEVYSLAILLHEEGLASRCRIYATDLSPAVLERAKAGIFPLAAMRDYTDNYLRAGGRREFSSWYSARYDGALFDPALRENVVFAQHDLATDGSFNEFNLILCRNVMIYFDRALQDRVHGLLAESLAPLGFLALGERESIQLAPGCERYETVDARSRLYRRVC